MAQTVAVWFITAEALDHIQARSCGMCNGQIGTWAGFPPSTGVPPYPRVIRSKTYRCYVKPRIIPKAIRI
jgi:hypothetical protein